MYTLTSAADLAPGDFQVQPIITSDSNVPMSYWMHTNAMDYQYS